MATTEDIRLSISRLRSENKSLRDAYEKSESNVAAGLNKTASLQAAVDSLKRDNQGIRDERDKYRDKYASLCQKYTALETDYDVLDCRFRDLERTMQSTGVAARVNSSPQPRSNILALNTPPSLEAPGRTVKSRFDLSVVGVIDVDSPNLEVATTELLDVKPSTNTLPSTSNARGVPKMPLPETEIPEASSHSPTVQRANAHCAIVPKLSEPYLPSPEIPITSLEDTNKYQQDRQDSVYKENDMLLSPLSDLSRLSPEVDELADPAPKAFKRKAEVTTTVSKRTKFEDTSEKNIVPTKKDHSSPKIPKIKVKKDEALILSNLSVSRFLKGTGPLEINPLPSTEPLVTREFLNKTYGASTFMLLTHSSDHSRRFIFPTADINPQMPMWPGHPGLLLSCRKAMIRHPHSLFSRTQLKPFAGWMYLGEYESVVAGQLSIGDFTGQDWKVVKLTWAKKLLNAKEWPEYREMRARIWLRKNKMPISIETLKKEDANIRAKKPGDLSEGDVIKALERGEEKIDVIRMTCVAYDHEFVDDMLDSWVPTGRPKSHSKNRPQKQGEASGVGRRDMSPEI
ncbi:hypothetical protein H0H81_007126 [Sphagnurus paluster]|uniref:DUF6697 domain-containing protein n=1 Tax=Sphagnurus paluster TaxID=117069 RepID=A0A9P7FX43_9AGAR|nr:hypothetical protein H0H81_007126 [Sphagnurus paluster]